MLKKVFACLFAIVLIVSLAGCKNLDYKKAGKLPGQGEYGAAAEIYEKLGDYKDSKELARHYFDMWIESLFVQRNYEEAVEFSAKFAKNNSEYSMDEIVAKTHFAANEIVSYADGEENEDGWELLKSIDLKSIDLNIGEQVYDNVLYRSIYGDDDEDGIRAFNVLVYLAENSHPSYVETLNAYIEECKKKNPIYKRINLEIGDTFTYGKYYYNMSKVSDKLQKEEYTSKEYICATVDDFNSRDVEWLVLDKQGSKLLVTTKNIVDAFYCIGKKKYSEELGIYVSDFSNTLWKDSYIREYLNSTFKQELLRKEKHNYIVPTTIDDCDTQDSIFLLSLAEVEKYKSVPGYPATVTPFAITRTAIGRYGMFTPYLDDYNKAMRGTYAFAVRKTADELTPPDDYLMNSRSPRWLWITWANGSNTDPELGDKRYITNFGVESYGSWSTPSATQYVRPAMWVDFSK